MNGEYDTVSDWFILQAGFKVKARCPHCYSQNISFYKQRRPGLKGISHLSKGITPFCLDCQKNLPEQLGGRQQRQADKKHSTLHAE